MPVCAASDTIVANPSPALINELPKARALSVTRISSSKNVSVEFPSVDESSYLDIV